MSYNLAEAFLTQAAQHPNKPALIFYSPHRHEITFGEFRSTLAHYQRSLSNLGLKANDRVLILTYPGPRFFPFLLAAFSLGITASFVDPEMKFGALRKSLKKMAPKLILLDPTLLKLKIPLKLMTSAKIACFEKPGWGALHLISEGDTKDPLALIYRPKEDLGFLTFTSGSTGEPKAADRSLEILFAQHEISVKNWPHSKNEIDMPGFPLVTLINLAIGITTVFPALNRNSIAHLDPEVIANQIVKEKVSRISASPAFYDRLTPYLKNHPLPKDQVHSLIVGGAPVPAWLCRQIVESFKDCDSQIVYGSTEAEPIAHLPVSENLSVHPLGYPAGHNIPEIQLKLSEINSMAKEVLIEGPHVVKRYLFDHPGNRILKIKDQDKIWHRTQDLGAIDSQGRLWLQGRIQDLISGLATPPALIEAQIENLPGARRAALLERSGSLLLFVQTRNSENSLGSDIQKICFDYKIDPKIHIVTDWPVDRRHNWKTVKERL